jgi:hypothetical protein
MSSNLKQKTADLHDADKSQGISLGVGGGVALPGDLGAARITALPWLCEFA